jgi:hypothetical protein
MEYFCNNERQRAAEREAESSQNKTLKERIKRGREDVHDE